MNGLIETEVNTPALNCSICSSRDITIAKIASIENTSKTFIVNFNFLRLVELNKLLGSHITRCSHFKLNISLKYSIDVTVFPFPGIIYIHPFLFERL